MPSLLDNRWVLLLSRWFLGAVFLAAASTKVPDVAAFALSIRNYDMVPQALLPTFATVLAGLEAVVGLALLATVWRKGASLLTCAMLAMFIVALSAAYLRGLSIDCGCFTHEMTSAKAEGVRAKMLSRIWEDVAMLALAVNLAVHDLRGGRRSGR